MQTFTFRKKGHPYEIMLEAAYRFEGGKEIPLKKDSIPPQARFPVVHLLGWRQYVAHDRALEFIRNNPDFRGGVVYGSVDDCGTLILVNQPDIGQVDEEAVRRREQFERDVEQGFVMPSSWTPR